MSLSFNQAFSANTLLDKVSTPVQQYYEWMELIFACPYLRHRVAPNCLPERIVFPVTSKLRSSVRVTKCSCEFMRRSLVSEYHTGRLFLGQRIKCTRRAKGISLTKVNVIEMLVCHGH